MTPELVTAIGTAICLLIGQIVLAWKSILEIRKTQSEVAAARERVSEVKTLVDGQRTELVAEIKELRELLYAATGDSGDAALAQKAAKDLAAKVKSDIAAHINGGNGGAASSPGRSTT